MTVPAHEATTRHLGAAYPFASEPGLGGRGVLVGRDLLGGAFAYDPFELYRNGVVTNPNMIVFGQIGRGKSAFVKTYLWRQAVFGRRAWVIDPKGEYGELALAWGAERIALRPGGDIRLNPLDDTGGPLEDTARRRCELLASLAAASLGRALVPSERNALDLAVDSVTTGDRRSRRAPTLPDVVDALLEPSPAAARAVRSEVAQVATDGRELALELRRLVGGDLRGMFDGPTTPGIALDGPLVVLDLSAVYRSSALGVLMTCATAWLHAGLSAGRDAGAGNVIVVVDEAWAILSNLGVARWLQSSWKLARAFGVANIAVLHRLSDLAAVGSAGSEQVRVAEGLLADSETRVLYAQSPGEVEAAGRLLGLSETEGEMVPHLQRGVALWKVGDRSFLVQHRLSPMERALVDTDGRMRSGVR
jgi:type IV secretory pathway VirB4 component